MKKFLSVLLALAVAFTFTFGSTMSAFASTATDQIAAKASIEKTAAAKAVDEALTAEAFDGNGVSATDATLTKAAVTQRASDVKAELIAAIDLEAKNQTIADTYNGDRLAAAWNSFDWNSDVMESDEVYIIQFGLTKADTLAEVAKVNPSDYNAFDYNPDNDTDDSDKAAVAAAVKTANATITDIVAPTDKESAVEAISDAKGAVTTLNKAIADYKTLAKHNEELNAAKIDAKAAIDTAAKNLKQDLTDEYNAIINSPTSTPTDIAKAQADLAALDGNVALVVNKYVADINAVAIDKDTTPGAALAAVSDAQSDATRALESAFALQDEIDSMNDISALIAYANTYAASMKNMVTEDGSVKYSTEAVEAALKVVVAEIKECRLTNVGGIVEYFTDHTVTLEGEAEALNSAKRDASLALEQTYREDAYRTDEAKIIATLLDEAKDAIDAAATQEELKTVVKEYKDKLDAVMTDSQMDELDSKVVVAMGNKAYANAITGLGGSLESAWNVLVQKDTTKTYENKNAVLAAAVKVFTDAVYAQNNPELKQAEVTAIVVDNYPTALAVINSAKSKEEIKALAGTVIEAINAIPTTVTEADKATVDAAKKAKEDYLDIPGAYEALIVSA